MGGRGRQGSRIDDLAALVGRCFVHRFQPCGVSIGGINDAAVGSSFLDLGGDFLDVGAVGDLVAALQLVQNAQVGQDLNRVAAHGHVVVAQSHQLAFVGTDIFKALDVGRVSLGDSQHNFVFQQVDPGVGVDEILLFQGVHLLLGCGEEEVALCALLDLGLQGAGGIKVEDQLHVGGHGLILLRDLVQGLRQGSSGKDGQLDALAGSLGRSSGRGSHGLGRGGSGLRGSSGAAAGTQQQGSGQGQRAQDQGTTFHVVPNLQKM